MTQEIIPPAALEKHVAILGKTGSGKSNGAKVTVENQLDRGERVCVIDPTGTWFGPPTGCFRVSRREPFTHH